MDFRALAAICSRDNGIMRSRAGDRPTKLPSIPQRPADTDGGGCGRLTR